MAHVFISYSHDDFEFAENLQLRLEKAGFDTWMDELRLTAGEDWREEIDEAIRGSFAAVLVLTPASLSSKYVTYEWSFAWGAGKKVIPLLLIDVDDHDLHSRLDKRHHLNFTTRIRPWDKLFQRLQEIKDDSAQPPSNNGDELVRRLENDLHNSSEEVREYAAKALGQKSYSQAIDVLVEALRYDKAFRVRAQAADSLGRIGDKKAIPALIDALRDDTGSVRSQAVDALGEIGDPSAIPALRKSLYDPDGHVRAYAAEALGLMQDKESVANIIKLVLSHSEGYVRGRAVKALGDIGDSAAVEALIDHLSDMEEWYTDNPVCKEVAKSLYRIGTPEALAAVEEWRHKQQNQP